MCGIAGCFDFQPGRSDKNSFKEPLISMATNIEHRGPDQRNEAYFDEGAIAIQRLSINDLSNKENVFFSGDKAVASVTNGELFNYPDLRPQLIAEGFPLKTTCDTEIIPHLYQKHGLDFPNHLNGQFGTAVWDSKKKTVILARDRFGITPLYYYFQNGKLFFASEIKAFLDIKDIPKEFNPEALDQMMTLWTTIDKTTFLKNVHAVPHGAVVQISRDGVKVNKYYDLDLSKDLINKNLSFEGSQKVVQEELHKSVDIRLKNSDVEVGTYLSGGVDSSIITKIAEQFKKEKLKTFSIDFTDKLYSEKSHQDILLASGKIENHRITVTHEDVFKNFPSSVLHAGQPIFRTAPIPLYMLSDHVHKNKIKVVLTGEGADEIFWGYDVYKELKIRQFWRKNPESKMRPALFRRQYQYLPQYSEEYIEFISSFYRPTLLDNDEDFYSHLTRWKNNSSVKIFFSADTREALKDYNAVEELRTQLPKNFNKFSPLSKCQYLEMQTLLPGYLLSSQGDRQSMAHAVESRIPFLDHNVVEKAATLPEEHKLFLLRDKYILRKAFSHILPPEIAGRYKQAYQAPEMQSFVNHASGTYVEHLFSKEAIQKSHIFDFTKTEKLYNKMIKSSKSGRFNTRDNLAFVSMLSTQVFYDKYIKKLL